MTEFDHAPIYAFLESLAGATPTTISERLRNSGLPETATDFVANLSRELATYQAHSGIVAQRIDMVSGVLDETVLPGQQIPLSLFGSCIVLRAVARESGQPCDLPARRCRPA